MSEWCAENDERISVEIDQSKYAHLFNLEYCIKPGSTDKSALLVLNQEINVSPIFLKLWSTFKLRVCADGGANRLYDFFKDNESDRAMYLPDYIIGDFDSLKPETEDYYKKAGVVVIKQQTQYSTDFTKALYLISVHFNSPDFRRKVLESTETNHSIELFSGIHEWYDKTLKANKSRTLERISLLALGGIDGRFDQTIHSITQLYKLSSPDSQFNLCYLSATDLIFFVPSGGFLLEYTKEFRDQCIGNCGLLPLNGPTEIIETSGLKWDVKNWHTCVGEGKVSSSNRFVGIDKCFIDVKDGIVMNVEVFIDRIANCI